MFKAPFCKHLRIDSSHFRHVFDTILYSQYKLRAWTPKTSKQTQGTYGTQLELIKNEIKKFKTKIPE